MSIKEILKNLYIEAQWKTMRDRQPALFREEDITQATQAILAEFERMLPEKEMLVDMCQCDCPNEMIDEKLNLIVCKACKKQVGEKNWNACLDIIKAKLEKERGGNMRIYETGFCWECGRICEGLFCAKPKKCQDKYERKLDSQIKKSKRQGYGVTGSTH